MERQLMQSCRNCGCSRCGQQRNCPNEDFACGECTPDNPAWNCTFYFPTEEGGRGR